MIIIYNPNYIKGEELDQLSNSIDGDVKLCPVTNYARTFECIPEPSDRYCERCENSDVPNVNAAVEDSIIALNNAKAEYYRATYSAMQTLTILISVLAAVSVVFGLKLFFTSFFKPL